MVFALCGSSAAASPVANFTSNVTNGTAPLSVQFNDTSTGNVNSWNWEFGDGNISTLENPTHITLTLGTTIKFRCWQQQW